MTREIPESQCFPDLVQNITIAFAGLKRDTFLARTVCLQTVIRNQRIWRENDKKHDRKSKYQIQVHYWDHHDTYHRYVFPFHCLYQTIRTSDDRRTEVQGRTFEQKLFHCFRPGNSGIQFHQFAEPH